MSDNQDDNLPEIDDTDPGTVLPETRTQELLLHYGACSAAREWVGRRSITEAWNACTTRTHRDWMVWLLRETGRVTCTCGVDGDASEAREKCPLFAVENASIEKLRATYGTPLCSDTDPNFHWAPALTFEDIANCAQLHIVHDIVADGDETIHVVPFVIDHIDSDGTVWCPATAVTIGGQDRLCYLSFPKAAIDRILEERASGEPYDSPQTRGLLFDRIIDT